MNLQKNELERIVCKACDFYKEGGEQLRCGALRVIALLLSERKIIEEDLSLAAQKISEIREKDTSKKV